MGSPNSGRRPVDVFELLNRFPSPCEAFEGAERCQHYTICEIEKKYCYAFKRFYLISTGKPRFTYHALITKRGRDLRPIPETCQGKIIWRHQDGSCHIDNCENDAKPGKQYCPNCGYEKGIRELRYSAGNFAEKNKKKAETEEVTA